jgi:hypothetical protein
MNQYLRILFLNLLTETSIIVECVLEEDLFWQAVESAELALVCSVT